MNRVQLIGNVGQDPTLRTVQGNTQVCNVNIATTEKGYTMANGTQVPDRTTWHTCIFWRKQAEVVSKYVHKGDKIFVEGKLVQREYEKDGVKAKTYDIHVETFDFFLPPRQPQQQTPATPQQKPTQQGPATAAPNFWEDQPF